MFVAVQFEVKQAREMMVEANTQEYAFNYLQQSLQNKIQDAEVRWGHQRRPTTQEMDL